MRTRRRNGGGGGEVGVGDGLMGIVDLGLDIDSSLLPGRRFWSGGQVAVSAVVPPSFLGGITECVSFLLSFHELFFEEIIFLA